MDHLRTINGIVLASQAAGFFQITEQQIHGAFDQLLKFIPEQVDQKRIGDGKCHFDTMLFGQLDRVVGGALLCFSGKQVAFDVHIFRLFDVFFVDIIHAQCG